MNIEQLDELDKQVVAALVNGVSDEDIMETFGVGEEKISQLRPVADEFAKVNSVGIASAPAYAASTDAVATDAEQAEGGEGAEVGTDAVTGEEVADGTGEANMGAEQTGEEAGEGSTNDSSAGDGSTE